jgi:hypothetical protein
MYLQAWCLQKSRPRAGKIAPQQTAAAVPFVSPARQRWEVGREQAESALADGTSL